MMPVHVYLSCHLLALRIVNQQARVSIDRLNVPDGDTYTDRAALMRYRTTRPEKSNMHSFFVNVSNDKSYRNQGDII